MSYYRIKPEVPGGWGENIVVDRSVHPPIVHKLHYEFADWLGDELVTSFPCFLVTADLAKRLKAAHLTGSNLDEVEVTTSEEFADWNPGFKLPEFLWLKVFGVSGADDFGLLNGSKLIISQQALDTIGPQHLKNALMEPWIK